MHVFSRNSLESECKKATVRPASPNPRQTVALPLVTKSISHPSPAFASCSKERCEQSVEGVKPQERTQARAQVLSVVVVMVSENDCFRISPQWRVKYRNMMLRAAEASRGPTHAHDGHLNVSAEPNLLCSLPQLPHVFEV